MSGKRGVTYAACNIYEYDNWGILLRNSSAILHFGDFRIKEPG